MTQIVQQTYDDQNRNIKSTLEVLEKLQKEELSKKKATTTPPNIKKEREVKADEKEIETELNAEMRGIDQSSNQALQSVSGLANELVSQAIQRLHQCKEESQAEQILKELLDSVLGETLETLRGENTKLGAKFYIAKKALHMAMANLDRKDKEIADLKLKEAQQEANNKNLRGWNMLLLQALEGNMNGKGIELDRDIF